RWSSHGIKSSINDQARRSGNNVAVCSGCEIWIDSLQSHLRLKCSYGELTYREVGPVREERLDSEIRVDALHKRRVHRSIGVSLDRSVINPLALQRQTY